MQDWGGAGAGAGRHGEAAEVGEDPGFDGFGSAAEGSCALGAVGVAGAGCHF